MPHPEPHDRDFLKRLSHIVFDVQVNAMIQQKMAEATRMMEQRQDNEPWGMAEIPMDVFYPYLPEADHQKVRLCRAFVLRAGTALHHPERHINSIQRLMAFKHAGTMHVATPGADSFDFTTFPIAAPRSPDTAAESFWDVIPPNTWHYPEAGKDADWQTLTFHSVSAKAMHEEDALHYRQ
jgi:hypothetical protein